jgi:hypothetical protein
MNWLELVMCSVQQIKTASNGLPKEELWILADWFLREGNSVGMTGFFCLRKPQSSVRQDDKAFLNLKAQPN